MEVYENGDAEHGGLFGQGEPNTAYAKYFTGNSYLKVISKAGDPLTICQVTSRKCETLARGKEGELVQPSGF